MLFHRLRARAAAAALVAFASPGWGHIEYYDLNQGRQIRDLTPAGKTAAGNDIPLTNAAYWTSTYQTTMSSGETWISLGGSFASGTWGYSVRVVNFDSSAWTDGLRSNPTGGSYLLGDTHKVDFANFHLSRDARVTISLQDDFANTGYGLNPSFSIYRGSAVFQAHDEATVDPLNPSNLSGKVQNAKDTGAIVDTQGIVSAYRNTLTNTGAYVGQFNALGGWSIGNGAGDWSAVEYVASATGNLNADGTWLGNANSNSLVDYFLPAGDYIIAFGGNAQLPSYAHERSGEAAAFGTVTNLVATLSFNATAVEGSRLSRLLERLGPERLASVTTPLPRGTLPAGDALAGQVSPVPEPRTLTFLVVGAVVLAVRRLLPQGSAGILRGMRRLGRGTGHE